MEKFEFTQIMEKAQKRWTEYNKFLNKLYEVVGCDLIEKITERDFCGLWLETLIAALGERTRDDLEYLVYECEFSLELFCDGTTLPNNTHPLVTNFEEFYDYMFTEFKED